MTHVQPGADEIDWRSALLRELKPALFVVCLGAPAAARWPALQGSEVTTGQDVVVLSTDGALDVTAERHVLVELVTARSKYFVHEPIAVRVRVSVEREFLEHSLVQLFRQRLDVPAQLVAPWIEDLPGAIALTVKPREPRQPREHGEHGEHGEQREQRDPQRLTFALNEGVSEAASLDDRVIDGRKFTVFEIERSYLASRPGELSIPAPLLRFAYATRFEEDFVEGRVAGDRRDAFVRGNPLTLTIQPLPEAGRPPEFTGAVGRFSVEAEASPRTLAMGESLKLSLRIEGEGNLEFFDPPRLNELARFHVRGMIDEKTPTRRTVTYDLAPQSEDATHVPPIRFAFFDTNPPAGYRSVQTSRISIVVRPAPQGAPSVDETVHAPTDGIEESVTKSAAEPPSRPPPPETSRALRIAKLVVLALLALGLARWLQARRRKRIEPDKARARGAAVAFHARATSSDAELADAFAEFLAARLGCSTPAVTAPDLSARLVKGGVPADLAARPAQWLEALVAARYGGRAPENAAQTTRELVDALDAAFQDSDKAR